MPLKQKKHILGGNTNLLESRFGGWIIGVWGAICGNWGLVSQAPLVLAPERSARVTAQHCPTAASQNRCVQGLLLVSSLKLL